jgi:hypothetical protein
MVRSDVHHTAPHKNWAKLSSRDLRTRIWICYTPKICGFVVLLARIEARIETIEIAVMLTFQALQPSRRAMLSVVIDALVVS